jgi:Putative esterase
MEFSVLLSNRFYLSPHEGQMTGPDLISLLVVTLMLAIAAPNAEPFEPYVAADDRPDSPRLAVLAETIRGGDTAAMARFWGEIEGKAPLIEPIAGDAAHSRVTFIWGSEPFADFLAKELVPWVRSRYRAGTDPARTVIAGQSNGGLAAAHAALRHADVFGCVLSQSGSFWFNPSVGSSHAPKFDTETGWLTRQFVRSPQRPVRFYVEVGLFEQGATLHMVVENRRFRDVLEAKGYTVTYSEYLGGHDYCCWRGSFADGLVALQGDHL